LPTVSLWPEVERGSVFTGPVLATGERVSLEAWLEFHRATLLMKCAGLTPAQLVLRSCPPSRLSLLGLVRHMTEVESWFHDFDGGPENDGYWTEDEPEAAFEALDPAEAEADLAAYQASVMRSRAAVVGFGLDQKCPCADCDEPASLRWVFEHMIEEYARHNGHADLIREAIDGATGD
jgi:Protein of unknown function (DUF664)